MRIAIASTGYVGLSSAIQLPQHHCVTAIDLIREKGNMIVESVIRQAIAVNPASINVPGHMKRDYTK